MCWSIFGNLVRLEVFVDFAVVGVHGLKFWDFGGWCSGVLMVDAPLEVDER